MSIELVLESSNGNFSFTGPNKEFLDVEAGKGMEPGDPKFTEKIFARSLLKAGATLALESLHEKEMVFPLKLTAPNKEALLKLVREINVIVRAEHAQVKWQDEGATEPTYFDLISGQLDDEYDFRLGQNNWLKCRLRLFCQPLGYNEAERNPTAAHVRGLATTIVSASNPVVIFPCASAPYGDAPALVRGELANPGGGDNLSYSAMSILPQGSYRVLWATPSAYETFGGAPIATTNAISGSFFRTPSQLPGYVRFQVPNGNQAYIGEQRILGVARAGSPAGLSMEMTLNGKSGSPETVATVSSKVWSLVDFGVLPIGSMALLTIGGGPLISISRVNAAVTNGLDIAGMVMLPESTTVWVSNPINSLGTGFSYDGINNALIGSGFEDNSSHARGAIPTVPPGPSPSTLAFLVLGGASAQLNKPYTANVSLLSRTRYAF